MLYISTMFCDIISNGIKDIERTRFLYWKLQRGIIPQKNVGGARRLVMLYISTKFCKIISNCIKVIERTRFLYWKFQRGIISQKNVGGVTVLISACRLIMFYICAKFREIISNGIKVMERTRMINRWRTDGRTDTQKFGGYNILPRHFLWWGIKNFKVKLFAKTDSAADADANANADADANANADAGGSTIALPGLRPGVLKWTDFAHQQSHLTHPR